MFGSAFRKVCLTITGGALAAVTATGPALATSPAATSGPYLGKVISHALHVREAPTLNSRVIDTLPRGYVVKIACKTRADLVNGNREWYLLSDGRYAWASARYIRNIGPAPEWC
jgi:hypothetical protein